jgi:hypothetical protein
MGDKTQEFLMIGKIAVKDITSENLLCNFHYASF